MTSRTRLTKLPMSGDALTDWMFRQLVNMVRSEDLVIYRMRRLHDPADRSRRAIRGIMDPFVDPAGRSVHILINPAKDANRDWEEEVETLVHELAHVIMEQAAERDILRLEKILARNLTVDQKRYLKRFLPQETIAKYPSYRPQLFPQAALAAQKKKASLSKI